MRPLRIVHVITKLELGGAQQNTLHTCRRLAELGHHVLLARGPGGLLEAETAGAPYESAVVPSLVRQVSPLQDVRALTELVRLMRAFAPDVAHTHSSKAGALGRLAAWRAGVPVVIHTVHGWSFSDNHPLAARVLYRAVEHALTPLTDHYVSVSQRDLDRGRSLRIVGADKGSVIRSGIDLGRFTPEGPGREAVRAEWAVHPGDVLVVNISCLKAQKAPVDFVRAAGRAGRVEPNLRFALVGDGELRADVQDAVRDEGLEGRFVLAGWRHDVAEILRAADVVALTSLWEGLPRVVVQARAVGRPVVATGVNGTPEVVVHDRTGVLVGPRDVDAMAEAFVRLARDPELRSRLGGEGRIELSAFSDALMVEQQVELYERLVRANAARFDAP